MSSANGNRPYDAAFYYYPSFWAIAEHEQLSSAEQLIGARLIRHANKQGQCIPSQETLAKQTGYSRDYVGRVLKSLERKGFISQQPRGDGKGGRSSNLITLLWPKAPGRYDYTPEWRGVTRTEERITPSEETGTPVRVSPPLVGLQSVGNPDSSTEKPNKGPKAYRERDRETRDERNAATRDAGPERQRTPSEPLPPLQSGGESRSTALGVAETDDEAGPLVDPFSLDWESHRNGVAI